jgi:PAS domain S-box-containing protein
VAFELEGAWLRELLDALPIPVVVYAPDGTTRFMNRARVEMAGDVRTLSEAVARMSPEHEDGSPFTREQLPGIRALSGETVTGERMRLTAANGQPIVVVANALPLRDAGGKLLGAVLVFHDITKMSELEKGRRELFSMANHDLRTPLTTVLGYAQLAQRQIDRDPQRALRTLREIERQALRMVRLVHDLLDVARFESGVIPVTPTLGDLSQHVRAGVERHSGEGEIVLQAPDTGVRAAFDADRVDQILDNLIANALRHTTPGTSVVVRLAVESSEAIVRVVDRGAGIAADEQARLFTPFYQTPRGRSYGGTGLGLHISRRIAEAHGGRLWLESTGTSGSTFAFALPVER